MQRFGPFGEESDLMFSILQFFGNEIFYLNGKVGILRLGEKGKKEHVGQVGEMPLPLFRNFTKRKEKGGKKILCAPDSNDLEK